MMVLAMVVALAVPALAVDGVTKNEQALYDHFCEVVDKWVAKQPDFKDRANQYKQMAQQTLVVADLDAAACTDLDAKITEVDNYLDKENPQTIAEMKEILPTIVQMVNATSQKYDITVAVSSSTQYAQCYVKGVAVVIPTPGKDGDSSTSPIKQTGFDMTSTIVVAAVLAIALLGSAVVIGKKRLAVNN